MRLQNKQKACFQYLYFFCRSLRFFDIIYFSCRKLRRFHLPPCKWLSYFTAYAFSKKTASNVSFTWLWIACKIIVQGCCRQRLRIVLARSTEGRAKSFCQLLCIEWPKRRFSLLCPSYIQDFLSLPMSIFALPCVLCVLLVYFYFSVLTQHCHRVFLYFWMSLTCNCELNFIKEWMHFSKRGNQILHTLKSRMLLCWYCSFARCITFPALCKWHYSKLGAIRIMRYVCYLLVLLSQHVNFQ